MPRSLRDRLWQAILKFVAHLTAVAAFKVRCRGRRCVPLTGGGMMLSNHQSHLDPIIIGLTVDRRLCYVARKTLFQFVPFRWLIESLDAIAIDRDGSGLGGLKETLRRLKRGEMVLMFPEGTRTPDGQLQSIKPGFVVLAKRAGVPLIPVALDGAFDAWPRSRRLPRPGVVHVQFGEPIEPARVASMTDAQLVAELESRLQHCLLRARAARQRAGGLSQGTKPEPALTNGSEAAAVRRTRQ